MLYANAWYFWKMQHVLSESLFLLNEFLYLDF